MQNFEPRKPTATAPVIVAIPYTVSVNDAVFREFHRTDFVKIDGFQ